MELSRLMSRIRRRRVASFCGFKGFHLREHEQLVLEYYDPGNEDSRQYKVIHTALDFSFVNSLDGSNIIAYWAIDVREKQDMERQFKTRPTMFRPIKATPSFDVLTFSSGGYRSLTELMAEIANSMGVPPRYFIGD